MKDLRSSQQIFSTFIKRFNLVIFIVFTMLSLSVAIILLYGIVDKASGENATPDNSDTVNFDQTTIDRIEQLKTSDQPSEPLDFSKGRINPFSE